MSAILGITSAVCPTTKSGSRYSERSNDATCFRIKTEVPRRNGMRIFFSYSSQDRKAVQSLIDDLHVLEHDVWFDDAENSAHSWWKTILKQIRENDLFMLAVSPHSLDSRFCQRELEYAAALGKPIMPIVIEPLGSRKLHAPLRRSALVYYHERSKEQALHLVASMGKIRPRPMPPVLPPEPPLPVPMSDLEEQVAHLSADFTEQRKLLTRIASYLDTPKTAGEARQALEKMVAQEDILVTSIYLEAKTLLESKRRKRPSTSSTAAAQIAEAS